MEREFGGTNMTILGKILVILNLVFALVVGGLLVVVYSRSTNWEAAFKKRDEEYKAARVAAAQGAEDATKALADQKSYEAGVKKRLEDEEGIRKDLADKLEKANKDIESAKKDLAIAQREVEVVRDDNKRLMSEKQLNEDAANLRDEQNAKLLADYNKLNQEATSYKILNESLRQRNIEIAKQLKADEDIIKAQGLAHGGATPGAAAPSYPPANVEGRVTQVDEQHGLLSISVGGDNGIEKDQIMDVWRIESNNNARYLGTVKILDVRAKEAVARPEKDRVQLKVGDHVGKLGG
jgi:hypothetical protein